MAERKMDIFQSVPDQQQDVDPDTIQPAELPLDAASVIIEMTQGDIEFMKPTLTVTDSINNLLGIKPGEVAIGKITGAKVEQADAEEMASFRRKINWRNPAVCFDGRNAVIKEGQEPLDLGAHLGGGAETPLVAAESLDFVLKGQELLDWLKEKGFKLGRHEADSNIADNYVNGCGCGACDLCLENVDNYNKHKVQAAPATAALMGEEYDPALHAKQELIPFTGDLAKMSAAQYTEILHDDGKGVHGHNEVAIYAEFEDGVSFDRDGYTAATGKKVFPIEFWYIRRLAEAFASHPRSNLTASEAYHSMVDFQIATYLGLGDGTHQVVIAQPAILERSA